MPAIQAELKVNQYLNEAHATEQALVTTLRAHIAMTPRGSYREALETHLAETREHARLVQERMNEVRGNRSLLRLAVGAAELGVGVAETVTGQVLAMWKAPIDVLRGLSGEEKLLKNAKDECATEALEIATYDALERVARAVDDQETAELAARIRRDEERMLARLREEIPALVEAVVGAELEGRPTYRPDRTGAADAVRRTARATGRAGRRRSKAVAEQAAGVEERTVEAVQTAAEETGRRTARTARTVRRRSGEQAERSRRRRGEAEQAAPEASSARPSRTTARSRSGGSSRAASGRSSGGSRRRQSPAAQREPWPGYDEQTAPDIREALNDSSEQTAANVLEYERQHKDRTTVEEAATREIEEG